MAWHVKFFWGFCAILMDAFVILAWNSPERAPVQPQTNQGRSLVDPLNPLSPLNPAFPRLNPGDSYGMGK